MSCYLWSLSLSLSLCTRGHWLKPNENGNVREMEGDEGREGERGEAGDGREWGAVGFKVQGLGVGVQVQGLGFRGYRPVQALPRTLTIGSWRRDRWGGMGGEFGG
jgi:hypothetical protein